MPLAQCFPYLEPKGGTVFAVGRFLGGLHIGVGYAEGVWDGGDHWVLDEPFDAKWFEACHGSHGVCREEATLLNGALPKTTHMLCEIPRLPWMDVHWKWLFEARRQLEEFLVDVPLGDHIRPFGGSLW